jgi:hypothetical protein
LQPGSAIESRPTGHTIRTAAGIATVILPEAIYSDLPLDKWGNPIEQNGQRMRGPLFNDPSVQKILA